MRKLWSYDEEETLVRFIADGKDWVEIAAIMKRSPDSCSAKATALKYRGPNKIIRHFDKGVSAGIKTMSLRTIAKPKSDNSGMRPCICCHKMFRSWNKLKNQRCTRCACMQDPGPFAL